MCNLFISYILLQANIQVELNKLCNHLPRSLTDQCTDFVKAYSKELIEMLLADLTPSEICVYLKLCDETKDPGPKHNYIAQKDKEICKFFGTIYINNKKLVICG